MKRKIMALATALCMLCGMAGAETVSFSGTVEARSSRPVYAPAGATVEQVLVSAGESVSADTPLFTLRTTKVYAPEEGTVTAVFGQPGDETSTVADRYGAVMYLEGPYTLSVSATTNRAYESKDNYIIHSGEQVYLTAGERTASKGTGLVTSVEGSSFTVLVTGGEYYIGDTVDIMRSEDYAASSRIGRGTIGRVSPTKVDGSGTIVSFAVAAGDHVDRGQLLFETVEGSVAGLEMTGAEIRAGVDGVVASLSVEAGATVSQNSTVAARIYPKGEVWVKAQVNEMDLKELSLGQKVKVELDWNEETGVSYEGTVAMISAVGEVGSDSTGYPVYVTFEPDEGTRYHMTAQVTTLEDE